PTPGSGAFTFTDANGNNNTASVASGTTTFTDTLGVAALTISGSGTQASPLVFKYPGPDGTLQPVTVNYIAYTVATNFGAAGIVEFGATNVALVDNIVLPDNSSYQFKYETTPGACTPFPGTAANCVTARLISVTLPTGGVINYAYTAGNNGVLSDGTAATLTRTTPDGAWTYAHTENMTAWITTLTDP